MSLIIRLNIDVGWVEARNPTSNDFTDWKCWVSPSVQPRSMPKAHAALIPYGIYQTHVNISFYLVSNSGQNAQLYLTYKRRIQIEATGRDSEIAPTDSKCVFAKILHTTEFNTIDISARK